MKNDILFKKGKISLQTIDSGKKYFSSNKKKEINSFIPPKFITIMKVNKFCFYIFEFCGAPSLAMFGCFHVFIILNAKTTKGLIKRKQKAWDCDLKKKLLYFISNMLC